MIDTLAYVRHLEAAGIDRKVAEAQIEGMTKHVLPDLATKHDLDVLFIRIMLGIFALVGTINTALFFVLRH